jgi:hypothetical protein
MIPASLYTPLFYHGMLLVVIAFTLLYWAGNLQARSIVLLNQIAMAAIAATVLVFMGSRPISAVFIDMTGYAWAYERVQQGAEAGYSDFLFNGLMRLCSPFLPVEDFFVVCAAIYILPLALASWRTHGAWAFSAFLTFLTAMSFWAYGVNGIRNGMATSVLILAFAFHDKPVLMFLLMLAAWGFHGSTILPAGAFLIVRYIKRTEIWLGFWMVCVIATLVGGHIGEMLLGHYNPFAWDNRVEGYLSSEGGGFRADFLAYSIVPVVATMLLAAPTRAPLRRFVARFAGNLAWNWIRNQSAVLAKGMTRNCFALAQASSHGEPTTSHGLTRMNCQTRNRGKRARKVSTREMPSGADKSTNQSEWERLPWVRLLRADPFYARLVNTYLLTNAVWILVIHANFSNRFAYLSWFMMPWVLVYPFIPGKVIHRPRLQLLAAVLFAQYLFTYGMEFIVYPLRGLQ